MECDFLSMCLSYVIGEEKSVAKTTFLKFFLTAQTAGKTGIDFPRPAYYTNRKRIINKEELMKIEDLCQSPLFYHIEQKDIEGLLNCLGAYTREYKKGEIIYSALDTISAMGLVLSGQVRIEQTDVWGSQNIFGYICEGQVFGETYACAPEEKLMVDAIAAKDSSILFLNVQKVLTTCSSACVFHSRLIANLLTVMARKNLSLSRKINDISRRSIRGRLLSYLSFQAIQNGSNTFTIPFNRQELADYLCVDRSALSKELGKMEQESLITFHKNQFSLHSAARELLFTK